MKNKLIFSAFALFTSVLRAETEIFADFLAWCTNEASTQNWAQVFTTQGSTTNVDLLPVPFGCDFGFRVGLGYCTCHDGWDVKASYTWYRTVGKNSACTDGEIASAFLGNFYINNADGKNLGPSYREASMRWTIAFNMFDGQLGRQFCASECLSLRPFIGLKGGWIHQSIKTSWENPADPALTFFHASENLKNNFWGVGPSAGIDLDWILGGTTCHTFSLFNDLGGALMYGNWTFTDRYQNDESMTVNIDLESIHGGATMVQDFIGFAWKAQYECFFITVRIGYEAQFWLGQLKLYTLNEGRPDNLLTLQGGTLDVRFAF